MKRQHNYNSSNSQVFYNFLGTVIRSGLLFFTMPLFTRMLGAEQYGLYSIYNSWLCILVCIIGCNVGAGVGTGYQKFQNHILEFRNTTLLEGTVISFFMMAIVLGVGLIYKENLTIPYIVLVMMTVEAFSQFIIGFSNNVWIYEKKAKNNFVVSLSVLLSTTLLSLLLISLWKGKNLYFARVIGTVIPYFVIAIIIWILLFKQKKAFFNKEYWSYSIAFGIPVIFHLLSHQILSHSDKIMMKYFGILISEIGIYSFYYSFVAILSTILIALNNSWCPFLYENLTQKKYGKLNKMVKNYVEVFTVITCGFLLLSREVSKIFAGNEYWTGISLIPVLTVSVYFTFIYQFPVNYEFYHAKPKIVAMGTSVAAILNIILNAIFIPRFGMYGAGVATLISYLGLSLMHIFIVLHWKLEKYPLKIFPLVIGSICVIISGILFYIWKNLWIMRWGVGIVAGIVSCYRGIKRKSIF